MVLDAITVEISASNMFCCIRTLYKLKLKKINNYSPFLCLLSAHVQVQFSHNPVVL